MYRFDDITDSVKKLKRIYKTDDVYEIVENLKIIIWEKDFGTDISSIKALTFRNVRIAYIVLNSNLPDIIKLFIVAHELGHYVLHIDIFSKANTERDFFSTQHMEIEANLLALS